MGMFFDQDIAHIARVMVPSLIGDLGRPILPAEYWRGRLHELLDATHLTRAQLCVLDSLLLQLEDFEAKGRPTPGGSACPCRSKSRQRSKRPHVVQGHPRRRANGSSDVGRAGVEGRPDSEVQPFLIDGAILLVRFPHSQLAYDVESICEANAGSECNNRNAEEGFEASEDTQNRTGRKFFERSKRTCCRFRRY
jgi:hypothetical protein